MSFLSTLFGKSVKTDWHDDVVTVAVEARRADVAGSLHDMVVSHYFRGLAVPKHESDWHVPTLRRELQRIAKHADSALAKKARTALRKLP